jgi:hypothetical protein
MDSSSSSFFLSGTDLVGTVSVTIEADRDSSWSYESSSYDSEHSEDSGKLRVRFAEQKQVIYYERHSGEILEECYEPINSEIKFDLWKTLEEGLVSEGIVKFVEQVKQDLDKILSRSV